MKRALVALLVSTAFLSVAHAQQLSFKDTVAAYNRQRIHTNKKGMIVLTGWGIANLGIGIAGAITAKPEQSKDFYEMTAAWGAINAGIGAAGLMGVRKEMNAQLNIRQSYQKYLATKRLYLINAVADVVYIGVGVGLDAYGQHQSSAHAAAPWEGYGQAIVIQGIFLLAFDNVMYASHLRNNSKWFQVMSEISVSNHGVGWVHPF